MKGFYKRPMVKFAVITLFAAILISFFIFHLYNSQSRKEDTTILDFEENKILKIYGRPEEGLSFCSYPDALGSQLGWDENESCSKGKSLRLVFGQNQTKHCLGIHFPLVLNLKPWLEKGILEFQIKGGENFSSVISLDVALKEGPIRHRMVKTSLPVVLSEQWQKLSFPLSEFLSVKEKGQEVEDEKFSWEIQEVLFSVDGSDSGETIELFIDDLRMSCGGEIIYELL